MCVIKFKIDATDSDGTIVGGEYKYKIAGATSWGSVQVATNINDISTPDITEKGVYDLTVRVKDDKGGWSDWKGVSGFEVKECIVEPTITIENIVVSTTAKNSKKCFDIVVSDGSTVNIETSFYADTTTQRAPTVRLSGGLTNSLTMAGTGINGTDAGDGIDSAKEDWTLTVNGTMSICIEAAVPPNAGSGETSDKLGVVRAGISFTDVGSVQVEATEV